MYPSNDPGAVDYGCIAAFAVIVFVIVFVIQAIVIEFAWNKVLIDIAGVDTNPLTFQTAMIVCFVLNLVGNLFSHKNTK